MSVTLDPSPILQTGFGFWSSKVLLSAVELGVFTILKDRKLTGTELAREIGMHPRGISDFFDALVAMKFLEREGDGAGGALFQYAAHGALSRSRQPAVYRRDPGDVERAAFEFWNDLPEALRTGKPQNEIKHSGKGMFEELYADPARLEQFLGGMTGLSRLNFEAFAEKFDFRQYQTLCDVGGATGLLCMEVAKRHPHMRCVSFDLPVVEPIAKGSIAAAGLADCVSTASGDFFADPLPKADVIYAVSRRATLANQRWRFPCRTAPTPPSSPAKAVRQAWLWSRSKRRLIEQGVPVTGDGTPSCRCGAATSAPTGLRQAGSKRRPQGDGYRKKTAAPVLETACPRAVVVQRRAEAVIGSLTQRLAAISDKAREATSRPGLAAIEWLEPLMAGGNWMPELIEIAGGRSLFLQAGEHSSCWSGPVSSKPIPK